MTKSRARVRIAGHDYTIGCAPGEEDRIAGLAAELEAMMARLMDKIGDVGDRTLAVMAGLTALDRLAAAEAANARLRARLEAMERAREEAALAIDSDDENLLSRLEMVTHTVEHLAGLINRDTRLASGAPAPEAPLRSVAVARDKPEPPAPRPSPDPVPAPPVSPSPEAVPKPPPGADSGGETDAGRLDIRPAATVPG